MEQNRYDDGRNALGKFGKIFKKTTRAINETARLKAGYSPKEIEKIKELQAQNFTK
ncbi:MULTISPECIES: hypothetical protein [unclassified Campylobacter]|uniref:hypothetical protein n=1 Tax=unclassified Campylobacter TaxID=2593542 RepID=UPI0022E9CA02|nr:MULTISPECIES: hypothetical protein [unclassified Campylobacter]MDA3042650.1 hypothetical protein [Campylobacter sp. JMF_09 ED2]MDA3044536.1 hypothetical protein [Campylobacter sp. JMF_07 ED4]MDA3063341.1 hypothetical protein [Campylobacter sp. JMF_11 EL3]MDA3071513.1 hypothetical protein [Campylobacter sp. VBCF_03 NA9]MDA3074423.1 hypothetical protein [Campylobacter sp. JMF_05 ED3]